MSFLAYFITVNADNMPKVVDIYYSSLKNMETKDINEALTLEKTIKYCFYGVDANDKESGFSGINLYDNILGMDTVASNVFVQRMRKAIHEDRNLKLVSYRPSTVMETAQPMLPGGSKIKIIQTSAEVKYLKDGKSDQRKEFIGIADDKICRISSTEFSADILSLTLQASQMYTNKKYKEAYDIYLKIIESEPDDANALYRLGVMTAKGEGTKKSNKKAKIYFNGVLSAKSNVTFSISGSSSELRARSRDAIYYLEHIDM